MKLNDRHLRRLGLLRCCVCGHDFDAVAVARRVKLVLHYLRPVADLVEAVAYAPTCGECARQARESPGL